MELRSVYQGKRLHLLVLDLHLAATKTMAGEYIVISIRDSHPGIPDAMLADSPRRRAILRLQFDDIYDNDDACLGFRPFCDADANRIVKFVAHHPGEVEGLIVHCEAGIARSAAVAAALSKAINGDDSFFDQHFSPNPRVRAMLSRQIAILAPEGWAMSPDTIALRSEHDDPVP